MNRLTKLRFSAVLLINDVFSLFCLMGKISPVTAAGFVSGIIFQMILSLPLALSVRNGKCTENCGKPVKIFFVAYLILWCGMLFSMLWNTSEVIYIPYENSGIWGRLAVSASVGLVCLYMTSAGMKTLLRSSLIVSAAGALCILIVVISALFKCDFNNLKYAHSDNFPHEFIRGISLSGSLGSFVLLLGNTNGDAVINSIVYFSAKAVVSVIILMTAVLVSGGIMEIIDFPVVISAQLSQPFPSQRIDSLFLIIFSVFGVFSSALQSALAVYLVGTISERKKYVSVIILSLSIMSAFMMRGEVYSGAYIAAAVLSVLIIPCFSGNKLKRSVSK